jgi:hypothetical protein
VLSVPRYTDSNYPSVIFKLLLPFVRSIAGHVDPRPVTRGDLTSLMPMADVRSGHRESEVKGLHFLLLTSQRVIDFLIITIFS